MRPRVHVSTRPALIRLRELLLNSLQKPVDSYQTAAGPVGKFLKEVAALKEAVTERDVLLSSITDKLKQATTELERQKISRETQAENHAEEISR